MPFPAIRQYPFSMTLLFGWGHSKSLEAPTFPAMQDMQLSRPFSRYYRDMLAVTAKYNVLKNNGLEALRSDDPDRFQYQAEGGAYLDLRGLPLEALPEIDEDAIAKLCRIVRGFQFAMADGADSGHVGGSSSKTEQILALLTSGVLGFDPLNPKHPGRDRLAWSAGHTTPLFHGIVSLIYECLRRKGVALSPAAQRYTVYPEQLARFRRWGGPSGHVESEYALADTSTGSSGHGFSAGLGFAVLHRSCGLATKAFVIAGDAESEEGMSYEFRNVASTLGVRNLIVTMDFNHFGIDGPITEVLPSAYLNHWFSLGWNIIEVDGQNVRELAYAYRLAADGFGGEKPTVVICHTTKGLAYGKFENSADSHGALLPHPEYVEAMHKLGFPIPGVKGDVAADIRVVVDALGEAEAAYLLERLEADARLIPAGGGAGGAHEDGAGRPAHGGLPQDRAPRRAAAGTGVQGRRFGAHPQGHGSLVRLGHEADRLLLYRRGRPDEVRPHRQGRERLRHHQSGQPAGPRHPLRHRRTEHGHDVLRHRAGYAARRVPAHDGLRHLRRIHLHDGQLRCA